MWGKLRELSSCNGQDEDEEGDVRVTECDGGDGRKLNRSFLSRLGGGGADGQVVYSFGGVSLSSPCLSWCRPVASAEGALPNHTQLHPRISKVVPTEPADAETYDGANG